MLTLSNLNFKWRILSAFAAWFAIGFHNYLFAIDAEQLVPMLPLGTTLQPNITTPEKHLGWSIGSRHIAHHEVSSYVQKLCEESDRFTWHSYGKTWGGRPLGIVIVSRPDRQTSSVLEKIQKDRHDWAYGKTQSAASTTLSRDAMPPSVGWLGYSVHGDEASGVNASMLVLYVLAAAQGTWIDAVLDDHVLLIDPSFNPDGMDRFAHWVNDHRGDIPSSNPGEIEHQQGWPRGRTNHYNFDLNRDWLPVTQPESQGRIKLFHAWLPNLLLDFHEMGESQSLFFQPGIEGRDHPMTPSWVREITQGLAKRYADVTDAASERYFTQERYDDFYPGKASTYPDLHGSVGILVEQGSTRGLVHEYAGNQRTFEETVLNPFRLSLASISGLHEFHRPLMEYQRDFYGDQQKTWLAKYPKAYLLEIPTDRRIESEFRNFATSHQLKLFALSRDYAWNQQVFKKDDWWLIPSDQPQGLFLQAIMDRTNVFPFDKFYDVSAWNMADAFGLRWHKIESDYDLDLKASEGESSKRQPLSLPPFGHQAVAVAIPGRDVNSMTFLGEWLQNGNTARMASQVSTVRNSAGQLQSLPPSSIVIHRADHEPSWSESLVELRDALDRRRLPAIEIQSGLTERGPDLGSEAFARILAPKIAMIVGKGTTATEAGSLWFTLDRLLSLPVARIEPSQASASGLASFNLLFISDGESSRFSPAQIASIQEWLQAGGHAVLLGGSVEMLPRLLGDDATKPSRPWLATPDGIILESVATGDNVLRRFVGDRPILVYQNEAMWPINEGVRLRLTDKPLLAGFLKESDRDKIAAKSVMGVSKVGRGQVTSMTFNPTFRGHYWGTIGLLREVIFREAE